LLNDVTLVLVPSRYEAFGLTALEAAQMARPVVATRVGGLPEVVVDGKTGLLVEPDDPVALARAIVTLLQDRGRAERLGRAARERARHAFSLERCVHTKA
jgi:glycosyltransferase involved in cell wall biosynthesis